MYIKPTNKIPGRKVLPNHPTGRHMVRSGVAVGVLLCLFAVTTAVGGAPSAVVDDGPPGYTITSEESMQFPPRSFAFQSQEYTVSKVAQLDVGGSLTVRARTPSDDPYRILLYNTDRQIVTAQRGAGDETFTFDFTEYDPGSYMLTLYQDGDYLAFHPVLIRGYAVGQPQIDAEDGSMRVAAGIDQLGDRAGGFTNVSVVVANESHTFFEQDAEQAGETYEATAPTDSLDPGTYHVYVGVRGMEKSFGRDELLGFSSTRVRVAPNGSVTRLGPAAPGRTPTQTVAESNTGPANPKSPTPRTTQPGFGSLAGGLAVLLGILTFSRA